MIVYFKVANYKSIKDPVVINFNATAISEHPRTNVFDTGKEKLLKTVLLYGSNASGKSKILDAFVTLRGVILESAAYTSKTRIPIEPFRLNTNTASRPSHFEIEFLIENKKYRYGFEADSLTIHKEWLLEVGSTVEKMVFLRIGQEFKIDDKKFVNSEKLDTRTNSNALFLSVSDQWNVPLAKRIFAWFSEVFTVHGLMDHSYRNYTNQMMHDPKIRPLINEMIRKADLGINSVEVERITEEMRSNTLKNVPENMKEKVKEVLSEDFMPVQTKHNILDEEGNVVREETFGLLADESEGTKKFYNIIGILLDAVIHGNLVVIDEMDARIHTLLTRAILRLFNGVEYHSRAQIFAVCHDTAVMDRELLRRDQVYLVEKDRFQSTKVVNLVEYKVRKETPFDKNYLEGKYGGIPFIENLENVLTHGS